ncbi:hypothetical protein MTR_5g043720 [Medicago truncatula]|uniref:Retrotransposon gag domain-containing protein n=1 Tax=Medicago truncatula TaxID=3880 RepID=G7JXX0_MEDTR|nr:hypothetical protein MTR_5g043720 [Medicago truncatula]
MDDSDHDMINLLTQQIGMVFNPLIQNMNEGYQALATQMGRIADFFTPPQTVYQRIPQNQNIPQIQNTQPMQIVEPIVQRQQHVPRPQPVEQMEQAHPEVILVDRNHDAVEVVRNIQQQNIGARNNIANLVENIMAQNGLNVGLHRPNFVYPLSEYVLQTELLRGYKIPKFRRFVGDTSESTIKQITRYLTEAGDIANNENLRLKFFPNSLTKNVFTWFTTLAPHSNQHWAQLQRLFHEQFYMGQSKISLASVRRQTTESINDYLNRVRQVERLKAGKARTHKFRREKVAYVDTNESEQEFEIAYEDVEDDEVNFAELKHGPPYTCKLLRPSDGRNPIETQNDKYTPKTYMFDLLMVKRRDLVQRALSEGRLKFGDKTKPQMQVDVDPLKDVNAMYTEVASCNVVEAIADTVEKLYVEAED